MIYKPFQCPSLKRSFPLPTPMLSKVVSDIGKNGEHPLIGARPRKSTCSMCRVMGQMPIGSVLAPVQIDSGTWGIFKGVTGSLGALNSFFVYGQPVLWGLSGTQIDPWRSMEAGGNVRVESAPNSTTLSPIPTTLVSTFSSLCPLNCLPLWDCWSP